METEKNFLTETDRHAIMMGDSEHLNNKGAKLYNEGKYAEAIEYYRLASAMGNDQATSNLGYCYLYGRSIPVNLALALGYFQIAALMKNVDAAYKLGDIYSSDKWGIKDKEMSLYYYRMAAGNLQDDATWMDYPSLWYALGREHAVGGDLNTDINLAYQLLTRAEEGYKAAIENGSSFYQKALEGVQKLLGDSQFDEIRARVIQGN